MPITDEQLQQLAHEAMEKEGVADKPRPRQQVDMNKADDRLRMASFVLGSALEAADKANAAVKSALNMFMAEWAAAMQAGVSPETLAARSQDAVREIKDRLRPKAFNQTVEPQRQE